VNLRNNYIPHLYHLILVIVILYGVNNYFFERTLFFNELLSVIGFCFFIKRIFKKPLQFSFLEKAWFFFIFINILQLFLSWNSKTNLYFYLRNSVILYSSFSIWIGYYTFPYFSDFFQKVKFFLVGYALVFLSMKEHLWVDRFSLNVFFPLFFLKNNFGILQKLGILVSCLAYLLLSPSATTLLVAIVCALIFLIPSQKILMLFTSIFFALFVSFFIYVSPYLAKYKESGQCCLYGNIHAVTNSHPVFQIDANSTWRLVVWYKALTERFPEYIIGIGYGTPLFSYQEGMHVQYYEGMHQYPPKGDAKYEVHVSGLHNTFLTLILRLGFLCIIFFVGIYAHIFSFFYQYNKTLKENGLINFFISFFIISTIGSVNLLLESPTYASLYWIFLGLIIIIIRNFKHERQS